MRPRLVDADRHLVQHWVHPVNYQIWVSLTGTQNSWAQVASVTGNTSARTVDGFSPQAGIVYMEYVITSWNSRSPSYGPAMTSLTLG